MNNLVYKQAKFDIIGITVPKKFALPVLNSPLLWLNNSIEKRKDVLRVVNFAKSIIMVGLLYARYPNKLAQNKNYMVIAEYAALRDYHKVLRYKLNNLAGLLKEELESLSRQELSKQKLQGSLSSSKNSDFLEVYKNFNYKVFVDAFPIYEKGYALAALGGTFGKNNLYQSFLGSKIVLGGLVTNLPIDLLRLLLEKVHEKVSLLYDDIGINTNYINKEQKEKHNVKNLCATCNLCFKHCPTGALQQGRPFNITKCISYLTIESKQYIPHFMQQKMSNWLFGCDVCQDVCPFNKKYQRFLTQKQLERRFGKVISNVFYWRSLKRFSCSGFYKHFAGTPILRMKYKKFKDRSNWYIKYILQNR